MGVRIEGLKRLRHKLGILSDEEQKAARKEVKRAALNIQSGAKRRVPVDTGRLRNSITHQIDDDLSATVGTNVEYAPYVEFGTRRMAAQPYLFPAFEEERPKFVQRIREAIDGVNQKVSR